MTLEPRDWRTLYNVADALRPAGSDADVPDLLADLAARLPEPGALRSLRRTLRCLELEARLRVSPSGGFSWLPRPERSALLSRWERSPWRWRREACARLRVAVGATTRSDAQSLPGA